MGKERFVDLIQKKKNGETLTKEEIDFMITDYVAGKIPDYQMSALLMAIYFRNMDYDEDYAPIKHSFGLNLTSEDLSIGFHYAF